MKELMNGYSPIFDVAKKTANKYYRNNYQIFLSNSIEAEDLIQETYVIVIEIIRKYPTKTYEEVFKLCNQAITWHLYKLRRDSRKTNNTFSKDSLSKNDEQVTDQSYQNSIEHSIYNYVSESEYHSNKFKFEELHVVLSEKEFYIISEIIRNRRTYEDLAHQLDCSKQYIQAKFKKILKKIRVYLDVDNKAKLV